MWLKRRVPVKIAQFTLRFIDIYRSYIITAGHLHCILALKVRSVRLLVSLLKSKAC